MVWNKHQLVANLDNFFEEELIKLYGAGGEGDLGRVEAVVFYPQWVVWSVNRGSKFGFEYQSILSYGPLGKRKSGFKRLS